MSDTTDDNTTEEAEGQSSGKNWRRDLEERAKTAETELAQLREEAARRDREDAFKSAGLDLSKTEDGSFKNKQHAIFAKAYDGKVDPEAIKAQALDAGFLTPPQDSATQAIAGQHASLDRASYGAESIAPRNTEADVMAQLDRAQSQAEFNAVLEANRMMKQG